jgi:hypothetical protein
MRSPSVFSDYSVSPSFLRTTPARKPRTECAWQPVASMIAVMVVPFGRLSSASKTVAFNSTFFLDHETHVAARRDSEIRLMR